MTSYDSFFYEYALYAVSRGHPAPLVGNLKIFGWRAPRVFLPAFMIYLH